MSTFERYLTLWVALCIVAGIALGHWLPGLFHAIGAAELALIQADREVHTEERFKWSELLSPNLLLVYGVYFTMGYTLYFNLTWLPTYLKDVRGFTLEQAGWLSGVVLFTGGVMTYVGGKLTDYLVKHYGLKIGRSINVVTLPIAGLLLVAAAACCFCLLLLLAAATETLSYSSHQLSFLGKDVRLPQHFESKDSCNGCS